MDAKYRQELFRQAKLFVLKVKKDSKAHEKECHAEAPPVSLDPNPTHFVKLVEVNRSLRAVKARSYIMTAGTKDPMSIFVPPSNLLSQLCTFPLGET